MEIENSEEIKKDVLNVSENTPKTVGAIETFAGDMERVIKSGESGIIRKIIQEEEEKEAIKKNISPDSSRNKLFIIASILLIFIAIGIFLYFFILKDKNRIVPTQAQFTPIIFIDKIGYREISGLNKDQIIQTILNERSSSDIKNGGIEGLYLTENKKVITLARFISLINGNLLLEANTFNNNFLIGVANEKNKDLFILLKSRSFLDIFSTLKNWESKMFNDLHGLFGVNINADTNYLLTKDFEDGFVSNKNTRILRDKEGKVVFEYVFADDNSVIIGNSDEAIKEVILRLVSLDIKK